MASVQDALSKWEIFCRVVDNYGDAGACWRLARALAVEYGVEVRLWVDDWVALGKLCPGALQDGSRVAGVELRRWTVDFPVVEPADVVIEAFACELPKAHVRAMAARLKPPVWINLEYLSAEDWVRSCPGLASPQIDKCLTKYFFFPGFTGGTGGLIREAGLFARRERSLTERDRNSWLEALGIAPKPPRGDEERWMSLFSYEQASVGELLRCWSAGAHPMLLLIPEGRALDCVGAA
ncbi:MAG: elongation factor P maturation arginine rhamnosyltransferase EarP, partial [Azoarcus sp.]|nr:elongation factor P maturation arginine rhamnosyltransferase EarP [Azoarcus sp.]